LGDMSGECLNFPEFYFVLSPHIMREAVCLFLVRDLVCSVGV